MIFTWYWVLGTDSLDFLRYRLGLREQVQVIRAAGFGIGAGHVEAAEGVGADHGSGAFAVDVEIAYVELAFGAVDLVAGFGIDGAGQAELGVVGDFQALSKPRALITASTGPKISSCSSFDLAGMSAITVGRMK